MNYEKSPEWFLDWNEKRCKSAEGVCFRLKKGSGQDQP
jgi:hypothetical protein